MEKIINDERHNRLDKLKKIKESGVDPYPSGSEVNFSIGEVKFMEIGAKNIKIAGRLFLIRIIGKLTFATIGDATGKIQIALQRDEIGEEDYIFFSKYIDAGDFISVNGELFKTHKGELTIKTKKFNLLAKALRPLPEKWHGLKDLEQRLRKRYLDLLANDDVRQTFLKRSEFVKNIRNYLNKSGFLEVETPILEQIPGGADAEPFITHHNTLNIDLYLRISLELHLKRLVVGGFEKVYEIGKVFRNEGMSTEHLQEFTLLEFYWAYADYKMLMNFIQDFYTSVIKDTFGRLNFEFQGHKIDFKKPWAVVDYSKAIFERTGLDIIKASDNEITEAIKKHRVDADLKLGRGRLIDQLYKKVVRPGLIQPTLLINLPIAVSPLAKRHKDNQELAERVVVVVAGSEVGNGFSELNDPIDQSQRFEEQVKLREAGDKEAQMMDNDFITALEHGMPPTAGFGVGIDRLLMIICEQQSIREVVLFPTMKPE